MTTKIIGHSGTITLAIEHLRAGINGGGDHMDLHLNTAAALIQSVIRERDDEEDNKRYLDALEAVEEKAQPQTKPKRVTGAQKRASYREQVRDQLAMDSKMTSQQRVAKQIGVAGSTVNRVINKGEGSDKIFKKIGDALGVAPPA